MSDLTSAIKQICEEKGLSYESVIETIESALAAAYRKDFGEKNQNIKVEFDPETVKSKIYDVKTIVEDVPEEEMAEEEEKEAAPEAVTEEGEEIKRFNPKTETQIKDAVLIKKTAKIGDELRIKLEVPDSYGRMAAQTAKQVIIQKLREAERDMIFNEFKTKENEVIGGVVQRRDGRVVLVDLGKTVGVLPQEEQIYGEKYNSGDRIKVYVKGVNITPRGPEIVLSRTSDEILKKIFYLEIPEISNGLIELKAVAREAGARSKVAVSAASENIDPIGSCIGQRGARIQTIISELGGEKVDIIEYSDETEKFIANALSPAKITKIETNAEEKKATVSVNSDQLSLAIGKGGQNVRLAAKLTGWKIDIIENKSEGEKNEVKEEVAGISEEDK
ncbi:MAG: transcription termination factor NusA [Patescibacteria group bacterium]